MATENFERIPPHNLEAEESVLGAVLIDRDAIDRALELLRPEDFYRQSHRKVFEAVVALNQRNEAVDMVTLADHLRNRGDLDNIGGPAFLAVLTERVPSAANVEVYARIVRDRARLRRLIATCDGIIGEAYSRPEEATLVVDKAENQILAVGSAEGEKKAMALHDLMGGVIEKVEKFRARGTHITGLSSGFADLDEITSGLHPGELIIVAGRPGMGKTAFALNLARNVAMNKEKGAAVLVFSMEMSNEQLLLRLLCAEGRINSHALRSGRMQQHEMHFLINAASNLYASPHSIYIDDSSELDIQTMRAKTRRMVKEKKIGLVVVDYLQMMSASESAENRQQEITRISRGLKTLSKELNIPVLVCSQLNRAVEGRATGKTEAKPKISDLRESGSIEQDADVVMLLYRKSYYDKGAQTDSGEPDTSATLDIAKQRSGPTGEISLVWHQEYTRFDDGAPGARP